MTIDFLKASALIREELRAFYQVTRNGGNDEARGAAMKRLSVVVREHECFVKNPPEDWKEFSPVQRWGYQRLLSHLRAAAQELKNLERVNVR